ncbi:hypothetical protein C2S53_008572 [Perilla frutescens var. hirtella]|uniref:Uncharacterized protein n=1 Tax=Perilla frutescens var. hirtella TaxID=608512 RepID=A0AAD4PF71_PERFH|nr:hypothetical protein C2S53_008572 [Perilla frutescens var. hirtella]
MEKLGVGGQNQETMDLEPTRHEMLIIGTFMDKFYFEEDDFDGDSEQWRSLEKALHCTNMRQQLITFLHQVRESKGYEVEYTPAFFDSPFMRMKLCEKENKFFYDDVMKAAKLAISEINTETLVISIIKQIANGKCYEFIGVEKVVWTLKRLFLLTICAKEFNINGEDIIMLDADADADLVFKTIRAVVFKPPNTFQFIEWSFKQSQ